MRSKVKFRVKINRPTSSILHRPTTRKTRRNERRSFRAITRGNSSISQASFRIRSSKEEESRDLFPPSRSKFGKNRLLSIPRVIPNSSQLVDARSIERIRNGATPLLISTEILLFSPPHNPVSAFFVSRSGKFGNAIRPPSPVPPNSRRGRVGFSGWDAKMKRGP